VKTLCLALTLAASSLLAQTAAKPIVLAPGKAANIPSGKVLLIQLTIPAPLTEVWNAFTTSDGLMTWLTPSATVTFPAEAPAAAPSSALFRSRSWLFQRSRPTSSPTSAPSAQQPDSAPQRRETPRSCASPKPDGRKVRSGTAHTNILRPATRSCWRCCTVASSAAPPIGRNRLRLDRDHGCT
jgi:hypothetical protein